MAKRKRKPPPIDPRYDETQGRPLTRDELRALVVQLREAEELEAQRADEAAERQDSRGHGTKGGFEEDGSDEPAGDA